MKKSCRTIFVILSGLWACMPASGQEMPYRYSLEECRAMALDSSKHIYGAELLKEKARYEKNAMLKNFFPKISVSGAYLYNNNDFNITTDPKTFTLPILDFSVTLPGFTIPIDLTHSYTAGIDIVQPIYMGGKIIAGYKMTRLAGEMAEDNRDLKNMEVILAVDEAYWTFVKTCKMYEAAVSFSETVDEVTKVVNDAVEVGFATENDRMKVKIEQNNARVLLSKAANGVKLSRMNLCHHIGIPLLTPIEVDTSGFSLNDDLTYDSASVAERPDYRLLEGKVRLKEENVKVIRADYLPQVGIMARYGYADALSLFDTRIIEGFGLSVMATIKIPICSWGAGMDKINSAKKDAQIERNEADILQEKMELERQMHHFNALDAKLKVEMCRSIREDAEALFRVSKDRYEVGTGSLASLLEAQTQWMKAKSDYIEAIAEYKLEYTKYLKAIGRLTR